MIPGLYTSASGLLAQERKLQIVSNNLANYQMKLHVSRSDSSIGNVTCERHCQHDFGDIRFIAADNSTELDYWIENYTECVDATFWINTSQLGDGDTNINMYYGTSGNTATTSNGTDTFMIFDDFENYNIDEEPKSNRGWSLEIPNDANEWWKAKANIDGNGTVMMKQCNQEDGNNQQLFNLNFNDGKEYIFGGKYYQVSASVNDNSYIGMREDGTAIVTTRMNEPDTSLEYYLQGVAYFDMNPTLNYAQDNWEEWEFWQNDSGFSVRENNQFYDGNLRNSITNYVDEIYINSYRLRDNQFYIDDIFVANYSYDNTPYWSGFGSEQTEPSGGNTPPTLTGEAPVNASTGITNGWVVFSDYLIAFLYLFMAMSVVYTAYTTPSTWRFVIIGIVEFVGSIFIIPTISTLVFSFMTASSVTMAVADLTPKTYWIMDNIMLLQVILFFISAVIYYSKNNDIDQVEAI